MFRISLLAAMAFVLAAHGSEVEVRARALFAPVGFDDNDEVTVVLDGYLPDACHRLIKPYLSIDPLSHRITVAARARRFEGECPAVTVPFTQEVRVGELPPATYTLVTKDGTLKETLTVKRANLKTPDDYLYAPVDTARVEYPGGERWVAVLEGRFTNTCLALTDYKVALTGRTIQLLPIMKLNTEDESGMSCHVSERPFRVEVELPTLEAEGRYLLHVRSLNGQAVNEAFDRTPHNP